MTENTNNHYNYKQIIAGLEKKGIELYGNHFKILEADYPIICRLIAYFLKDEISCYQYGIDLNKGLLLSGPIGSGKTTLMNLMKLIAKPDNKFSVKPFREISFELIQDGYEVIHRYSKGKLYQSDTRTFCFDDLGTEKNLKY